MYGGLDEVREIIKYTNINCKRHELCMCNIWIKKRKTRMLHKTAVERATFELLKELMQDNKLSSFNLAGGTALSLYLHLFHRVAFETVNSNAFINKI